MTNDIWSSKKKKKRRDSLIIVPSSRSLMTCMRPSFQPIYVCLFFFYDALDTFPVHQCGLGQAIHRRMLAPPLWEATRQCWHEKWTVRRHQLFQEINYAGRNRTLETRVAVLLVWTAWLTPIRYSFAVCIPTRAPTCSGGGAWCRIRGWLAPVRSPQLRLRQAGGDWACFPGMKRQ